MNSTKPETVKQKSKQTSDLRRLIFSPPLPITAPTAYSQQQQRTTECFLFTMPIFIKTRWLVIQGAE